MKKSIKNLPSLKSTLLASFFFGLLMFGLYVFQVNSLTMLAYNASNAETELRAVNQETAVLETAHQRAFALPRLGTLAENLRFEKAAVIQYIHILPGAVARSAQTQQ